MKSSILLTITASLLVSFQAQARISIGNGGQIVECKGAGGEVTREAFDLYEGSALFGYAYPRDTQNLDPAKLALALAAKMDAAQGSVAGVLEPEKNGFENRVRYVLDNMNFLPPGVGLQPTGDTQEFIRLPQNCDFVQAINFRDNKRIYVNSDVWNELSPLNRAALYLHEAVYWYLRETGVEADSRRTRKAVSYIMAGGALSPRTSLPSDATKIQYCRSSRTNGKRDYDTKFLVYRDGGGNTVAQFFQIGGYRILTRTTLEGALENDTDYPIEPSVRPERSLEGAVVSPIDIDALVSVTWGKGRVRVGGILQPNSGIYDTVVCQPFR